MGKLKAGAWLLAALAAMFYVVAGVGLAWLFDPKPFSDWHLYWTSAGAIVGYERGGVGLWLLALPKALGLGPVASALALNLPAGLATLWLAWRADGSRSGLWTLLAAAYLAMLAPFAGLVQLDVLASAFVAGALMLLASSPQGLASPLRIGLALALLTAGVSTKPQYALLAWAIVGMLAIPAWLLRRREAWAPRLLAVLLVGSVLGFALDLGLRHVGERGETVRANSGVTLYAGLLAAEPVGNCGFWSQAATDAAREDMAKPLLPAIRDRLAARPAAHWRDVFLCKLPKIVMPPAFALSWFFETPSMSADVAAMHADSRLQARLMGAYEAERQAYRWLVLAIALAMAAAAVAAWRRGGRFAALLVLAWPLSFWGVHLVFEIQGRYFLGLYLLAPIVAALALRLASREVGARESSALKPSARPGALSDVLAAWLASPGRSLALLLVLLYVVAGGGLALLLDPQPFSDWVRYWNSAGALVGYERGGVGLWLVALLKGLGFGPVGSALAVNLPAGLVLAGLAWRADGSRTGAWTALTAAYLVMLVPYAGIVQLDLVSATFVAAALVVLAKAPAGLVTPGRVVAAVALLAAGVSTKPQYALLAWAFVGLLALPAWWLRRREAWAPRLLAVVLAGSVLGFAADLGLRHLGERGESLRTVSAVTLYAGLLATEPGPGCGYWSPQAMQAAHDDAGKALLSAVGERLSARPASHWRDVVACKLPEILQPQPFALYWLVAAPSVQSDLATLGQPRFALRYGQAVAAERGIYGKLLLLVTVGLGVAAWLAWRRGGRFAALLILAWPASFWAVHLVFEIQGRYFLGLYLLAPLVAALALAQADRRPKTPSFQGTNR